MFNTTSTSKSPATLLKRLRRGNDDIELDSSRSKPPHRPLPRLSEFSAISAAQLKNQQCTFKIPLLELAIQRANESIPHKNPAQESILSTSNTNTQPQWTNPLQDSSRSTLSRAQHARYLYLLSLVNSGRLKVPTSSQPAEITPKTTIPPKPRFQHDLPPQVREFQSLAYYIAQERVNYAKAIVEFRQHHTSIFFTGIQPPSPFAALRLDHIHSWHQEWLHIPTRPTHFELEPTQTLLLQPNSKHLDHEIIIPSDLTSFNHNNTAQPLKSKLLAIRGFPTRELALLNESCLVDPCNLPKLEPLQVDILAPCRIESDTMVNQLAQHHNIAVVLTLEAWLAILLRPSGDSLVILHRDGRAYIDDPIPQPCTPRDWMTQSLALPLARALEIHGGAGCVVVDSLIMDVQETPDMSGRPVQYLYNCLTLPGGLKILVRSAHELVDSTGRLVQSILHLDYFQDQRECISTNTQTRISWTAYLVPKVRILLANTCMSSNIQITSIETAKPNSVHEISPETTTLIRACIQLRPGYHLVSFFDKIVKIYNASSTKSSIGDEFGHQTIEQAKAVFLEPGALAKCFRMFQWQEHSRASYTFPPLK